MGIYSMESVRAPYGVRADHSKQEYYVYEIATDKNIATFRYRSEITRGVAFGTANIKRKMLNEDAAKKRCS